MPRNWIFSDTEILNTPSFRKGICPDNEDTMLRTAADAIAELCVNRGMSKFTTLLATVLMQRFYTQQAFDDFLPLSIVGAAVLCAAKVHEVRNSIIYSMSVSMIEVLHNHHEDDGYINPREYTDYLIFTESILLQTIGFDTHVELPHLHILQWWERLQMTKHHAVEAYRICDDVVQHTRLLMQYTPLKLACFCIFYTSKCDDLEIPVDLYGRMWVERMDPEYDEFVMVQIHRKYTAMVDRMEEKTRLALQEAEDDESVLTPSMEKMVQDMTRRAKELQKKPRSYWYGPEVPDTPSEVERKAETVKCFQQDSKNLNKMAITKAWLENCAAAHTHITTPSYGEQATPEQAKHSQQQDIYRKHPNDINVKPDQTGKLKKDRQQLLYDKYPHYHNINPPSNESECYNLPSDHQQLSRVSSSNTTRRSEFSIDTNKGNTNNQHNTDQRYCIPVSNEFNDNKHPNDYDNNIVDLSYIDF